MKLTGMNKLMTKLQNAESMNQQAAKVVKRHTANMTRKAQRKAPVDTGELRRSITASFYNGGLEGVVRASMQYAPYVEYGTRYMTAQPFIRPAYHETVEEFKKDLDELVK